MMIAAFSPITTADEYVFYDRWAMREWQVLLGREQMVSDLRNRHLREQWTSLSEVEELSLGSNDSHLPATLSSVTP